MIFINNYYQNMEPDRSPSGNCHFFSFPKFVCYFEWPNSAGKREITALPSVILRGRSDAAVMTVNSNL